MGRISERKRKRRYYQKSLRRTSERKGGLQELIKKLSNGYRNLKIAYDDSSEEESLKDFLHSVEDEVNFTDDIDNISIKEVYSILKAITPKGCSFRTVSGAIGFWPSN